MAGKKEPAWSGKPGTPRKAGEAGMEINYLAEIIAFERWLETHYLPISSQLLWYKMMSICNKNGWSEWVTVDNLRLMAAMQMSREATLIKARDELIKAGRILYQKGKKGSPNKYKMMFFAFKSEVESEVKGVVKSEVKSAVKGVAQSADIYKQKQKQKQKKSISDDMPENHAPYCPDEKLNQEEAPCPYGEIIAYLNLKTGSNYRDTGSETKKLIKARCNDGYALDDFKTVIDKKAAEWGQEPRDGEKDMRPYLRPSTLFGNKFESYLNQKPPRKNPGARNQFHYAAQRDTDYDALLLERMREQAEKED